jgi:hypothetical protein
MMLSRKRKVFSMNLPPRKKMVPVVFIAIILFLLVTGKTPFYANGTIEIILKNFYDMGSFQENNKNSRIVEVGIPAGKHILIVKSCQCLDDARDKNGNAYYFYMVDQINGLKALITDGDLDPVGNLDTKTRKLCKIVEREIQNDGGIKAIINKFKNKRKQPPINI